MVGWSYAAVLLSEGLDNNPKHTMLNTFPKEFKEVQPKTWQINLRKGGLRTSESVRMRVALKIQWQRLYQACSLWSVLYRRTIMLPKYSSSVPCRFRFKTSSWWKHTGQSDRFKGSAAQSTVLHLRILERIEPLLASFSQIQAVELTVKGQPMISHIVGTSCNCKRERNETVSGCAKLSWLWSGRCETSVYSKPCLLSLWVCAGIFGVFECNPREHLT